MSEQDLSGSTEPQGFNFYDLAAKFAEETSSSDRPHRLLKLWAHRFPEHASDLAAIAYARLIEPDPGSDRASAEEELAIMQSAQRVLDRFRTTNQPLTSLVTAAGTLGISTQDMAQNLRIDIPLFAKLEQRLLEVRSIPSQLIEKLAESIGRSSADIVAYLSAPPRLASNASYKSGRAPGVSAADRQSFAEALSSSRMMSAENREYWLELLATSETEQ